MYIDASNCKLKCLSLCVCVCVREREREREREIVDFGVRGARDLWCQNISCHVQEQSGAKKLVGNYFCRSVNIRNVANILSAVF